MAELASGAVTSLLGVIRNEARLLGRVRGDVQFIKEEMESMNSFLAHLARTVPAGGEHDEQVRTWMNQVRLLAQDCNNCIDLYLYRRNPDIHRAKGGVRRYLWWAPWFVQKMAAQHRAAVQLRTLKDRARDVGERRLRYGVEVPDKHKEEEKKAKQAVGQSPPGVAPATSSKKAAGPADAAPGGGHAAGDYEEDGDDQLAVATSTDRYSSRRRAALLLESTLEDYFKRKLLEWIEEAPTSPAFIAIVAPHTTHEEACALACEVLDDGYIDHVLVDIPAVHLEFLPLRPKDILFYILREVEHQAQLQEGTSAPGEVEQQQPVSRWRADRMRKRGVYNEKKEAVRKIKEDIQDMKVWDKLEMVKTEVLQVKGGELRLDLKKIKDDEVQRKFSDKPLGALLLLLLKSAAAHHQQDQASKKRATPTLAAWYDDFIRATAKKLKAHMEQGDADQELPKICLHKEQYRHILREVFPKISDSKDEEQDTQQATKIPITTTLDEDQIKEIVDKVRQQILQEVLPMVDGNSMPQQAQEQDSSAAMQDIKATTATLGEDPVTKETRHEDTLQIIQATEDKSDRKQATGKLDGWDPIPGSMVEETMERIENIKRKIKQQLKIKGIMDRIEEHAENSTMIILKIGETMDGSVWEETRNALSLLDFVFGALIITTSKSTKRAKEYCYPPWEPIDCSVVGLYHATVLALTSQRMQQDNYNPQIFHDIVNECEPHEFCMKMFTHALYAKPTSSNEELDELLSTLKAVSPKTFIGLAKKMFKFSYNDLPQEYKSCLLYLSIFPQGHNIRRSTLIGRWVAEGLITKEDWPTSVRQAERCFDALIDRWLVYPGHIGATGKVKSCVVGGEIHGFIKKVAKKQHIVEARLSHHLARHFSIFNYVRLRGSDRIDDFFRKLPESHQLSLLKVLDLEGCHCFGGKNQSYLTDICSNILLLKYLSLKRTNVTQLPSEINNLHELEVLDIRQTEVPAFATKNVLLLKLKRLLGGQTVPSPSNTDTGMAVQVPDKIEKMLNMEVLSNVKPRSGRDLEDIGTLWQLKKLGLVINKDGHLINLVGAISNLHETLRSLSITLPITSCDSTLSSREFPDDIHSRLTYHPKLLESLSICGITAKGSLLSLLAKDANYLVKVTLTRASLHKDELNVLAKLPMLSCVRLRHIACTERKLTFQENEFRKLKYFLVEGSNITDINIQDGAVLELEKIVLSFTGYLKSLSGVDHHPKLKELELNNNSRLLSLFDNAKQIAKLTLHGTYLKQGDIKILAKKPNMRCLVLLGKSYDNSKLTFDEEEFPKLNLLIVDCSIITNISFARGSTPKLEKIIWSFTKMESLSGIGNLSKLKVLEFNGDHVPEEVNEAIKKHKNGPGFNHYKPERQEQVARNAADLKHNKP